METSFDTQQKRRHTWVSLPTISQDENDEGGFDIFFPPTKRFRSVCEKNDVSPDVISDLDTLECDTAMDVSINSVQDGESVVEWWKEASAKQGQRKLPMLDEDDLMCHVCDSVYKKPTAIASSPTRETGKPENSILTYFKCTSKAATERKPSTVCVSKIKTSVSTACTFCERSTCRCCLERCEKCQQQFCRLCITNDYFGNYSRVLCLDCVDNGSHEDAMMNML